MTQHLIALLLGAVLTHACHADDATRARLDAADATSSRPNILFVLTDDQSYPFLHCYGTTEMKTPNLDRFASEGIKFHRMFTTAPQCVPSRASIMTGRSPIACRISRFSSPLAREEVALPEILRKEAGYFVGVLGRTYHLAGSPGNNPEASQKVFDEHKLATFKDRFDYVDASNQQMAPARIKEFFDQRPKDKPYFLWVNFNDPHHPWDTGKNPHDPAAVHVPGYLPDLPGIRKDLSQYEGEIEHADGDFQTVLDSVKERAGLENTLVIFMGDNGLAFPSGKGCLRDPGLNVPLIAWCPGAIKPGGDSRALISGEDIAPTCLEAAGVSIPKQISGVSFLRLLRGGSFPRSANTSSATRSARWRDFHKKLDLQRGRLQPLRPQRKIQAHLQRHSKPPLHTGGQLFQSRLEGNDEGARRATAGHGFRAALFHDAASGL